MENFTPVTGFVGGLMIGGAATLFVALNGRVAGISGILGGLLEPRSGEWLWRGAFVLGIVVGPWLVALAGGHVPDVRFDDSWPVIVIAGLLVGYGTRLGNGCTSGHGVCGLSRGSPRSVVATAVFFSVAVATTYLMRHVAGS